MVASWLGVIQSQSDNPLAFYQAAAAGIPVLLIAIAYQANASGLRIAFLDWLAEGEAPPIRSMLKNWFTVTTALVMLSAFGAEAVAFWVLGHQAPTPEANFLISLALFLSGWLLLTERLMMMLEPDDADSGPRPLIVQATVFVLLVVLCAGLTAPTAVQHISWLV